MSAGGEAGMTRPRHDATGRKRLRVLLCATSGLACAAAMAIFMSLHGLPYDPIWWWVMGLILVLASILPRWYALAVEWVIAGYRAD